MVDVVPDQVPPLELLQGLGLLPGLVPVDGRKLEDAVHLPGGQEGKEVAQVGERLDIVHVRAALEPAPGAAARMPPGSRETTPA